MRWRRIAQQESQKLQLSSDIGRGYLLVSSVGVPTHGYHSAELLAADESRSPNFSSSSSSSAEHQLSNCLTLISSGWLSR